MAPSVTRVPPARGWTVLVVDDHALVGQFLARALTDHGAVVELIAGPTSEAIVERCQSFRPDVVVLDLDLGPQVGSGRDLIRPLAECGARVMVLTGGIDPAELGACIDAGAAGVATKEQPIDALLEQIEGVAHDQDGVGVSRRAALLEQWRAASAEDAARLAPFRDLTVSEQAVLAGLLDGASLNAIASARGVSLATVRTQVRMILQKLGVKSQLEAVTVAGRAGWRADLTG